MASVATVTNSSLSSFPPPVFLGPEITHNSTAVGGREWLEANGRGSYALGAVGGGSTRRYHGFLTVALRPPLWRFQLVNRVDEWAMERETSLDLSPQTYAGSEGPADALALESFRLDPFPIWTYRVGESRIEKSYFLRYGEDTGVLTYRLLSGPSVTVAARPLLSFRDHHRLAQRDSRFDGRWHPQSDGVRVLLPEKGALFLRGFGSVFEADPLWFNQQFYGEEQERGLENREDVFGPGVFRFLLKEGQSGLLVLSTAEEPFAGVERWQTEERDQRHRIVRGSLVRGALGRALSLAADSFVVSRGEGTTILAGYPWFGDWSRDALGAFPGLFLATGRWAEAPPFLETFARHLRQGLLPNFFPDGDESLAYNAADAPLWFIRAVQAYHRATHDDAGVRKWLPAMRDIVDAFEHGAGYGIHMDGDGLIVVPPGEGEVALTWMDARVDGKTVTPRGGKPVEIQALWYNALQFLVELQLKLKESTRGYGSLAEIARRSFNEKFWNESTGFLNDVVDGKQADQRIRPNALLALSLPYEILEEKKFSAVVETAERELWTPWGLRTLAPSAVEYRGQCVGGPTERDRAYHQGTVWAWFLGPFLTAFVKARGATEDTKARVVEFLRPWVAHLSQVGVGQVSQIFDGDAPHTPRGGPAHAWSVGELLRVMWEEGVTL